MEGGAEGGGRRIVGGLVGASPAATAPPGAGRAACAHRRTTDRAGASETRRADYPDPAPPRDRPGNSEATVGTDGCVESVTVLRSRHPLLDHASVAALKQWQYTPLVLNGIATPFVLTVTFNFNVGR